jgi:hypothetical protein
MQTNWPFSQLASATTQLLEMQRGRLQLWQHQRAGQSMSVLGPSCLLGAFLVLEVMIFYNARGTLFSQRTRPRLFVAPVGRYVNPRSKGSPWSIGSD